MLFIAHEAKEKWRAKSPTGGKVVPKVPKGVHFCCGDPAEGLQVGRSLPLACTQKDLPMNRPTDEARLYGFHRREAAINSSPARAIPPPLNPPAESGQNLLNLLNPGREAAH